jgi:hypothetical protein
MNAAITRNIRPKGLSFQSWRIDSKPVNSISNYSPPDALDSNPPDQVEETNKGFDWGNLFSTVINTGSSILTQTQAQKTAAANAAAAQASAQASMASASAQQKAMQDKIALLNSPTAQAAENSKILIYVGIGAVVIVIGALALISLKK